MLLGLVLVIIYLDTCGLWRWLKVLGRWHAVLKVLKICEKWMIINFTELLKVCVFLIKGVHRSTCAAKVSNLIDRNWSWFLKKNKRSWKFGKFGLGVKCLWEHCAFHYCAEYIFHHCHLLTCIWILYFDIFIQNWLECSCTPSSFLQVLIRAEVICNIWHSSTGPWQAEVAHRGQMEQLRGKYVSLSWFF